MASMTETAICAPVPVDFAKHYEVEESAHYLVKQGFRRIALQFPDELLKDSPAVAAALGAAWGCIQQEVASPPAAQALPDVEAMAAVGGRVQETFAGSVRKDGGVAEAMAGLAVEEDEARLQREQQSQEWRGAGRGVGELQLYVMADSTYGSCCVDEVAAAHVDAQCILHYGHACMSPTSRLPARFVLGRLPVDAGDCARHLVALACSTRTPLLVLYELLYAHALAPLQCHLAAAAASAADWDSAWAPAERIAVATGARREVEPGEARESTAGLLWELPEGRSPEDCTLVWIGSEGPALTNLLLTYNACKWVRYDPLHRRLHTDVAQQSALLRRRYYLVERAKDASIVGIVAGTLGVAGYQAAIERLRGMVAAAGKRSYTVVMGRPTPAKLANFPECEVFVLVACPQTALLDSKEFLAPVITPFEAELAFTRGKQWTGAYRLGFGCLLPEAAPAPDSDTSAPPGADAEAGKGGEEEEEEEEPRFSLVQGGYVSRGEPRGATGASSSLALSPKEDRALQLQVRGAGHLALRGGSELAVRSGMEYFEQRRQYKGLEVPPHLLELAGEDASQARVPVGEVVPGRSGRAAGYSGEGTAAQRGGHARALLGEEEPPAEGALSKGCACGRAEGESEDSCGA